VGSSSSGSACGGGGGQPALGQPVDGEKREEERVREEITCEIREGRGRGIEGVGEDDGAAIWGWLCQMHSMVWWAGSKRGA
jgi:hypothetical protein